MKSIVLTVALTVLATAQDHPAPESTIRHVTIINVATGAELKDQTVRIQGTRISVIARTQDSDATPNSIDAHGAYLLPGLWDMHVNVHDTDELPLYIANGVTGIRIMSGERDTAARRAELARESKCKAQISWIAGYVFGGISATPSQEHTHQSRNTRAGSV